MPYKEWLRPPRHLLLLFLTITFVLAAAWGWSGFRLLEQERALGNQRLQERLDRAADLIVAALLHALSNPEEQIAALPALPEAQRPGAQVRFAKEVGDDVLVTVFDPQRVAAYPPSRLLYYPVVSESQGPSGSVFTAGETLEFQQKDFSKAIEVYRKLTRSRDPATRAGALLRLGRSLRRAGQLQAALAVYDQLAQMRSVSLGGLPAELLAREARCELLEELRQGPEVQREARALDLDLHGGHWQLTRPAYLFYEQQARHWLNPEQSPQGYKDVAEQESLALAAGVEALWEEWQRIRRGEGPATGRRSLWLYGRSVLLLWRSTPERLAGLVAGSTYLQQQVLLPAQPLLDREGVQIVLTDGEGHQVRRWSAREGARQAVRTSADTRLPWTLGVASLDPSRDITQLTGRRRLLVAGWALIAAVVFVGSYFIARAMMHELEVARLQSDFVSAVSHEFRTPLASLRQLSELLADGRVPSEQRRQEYYQALSRESERLHRLVEGLLDFGRMEAGAKEYRFETLDPAALVREVVAEFAREAREQGFEMVTECSDGMPPVRADREALSRAVWNLLDNAVKYSPGGKQVWVETRREGGRAAICVRDRGLGIPPGDQARVFRKFVRGESARTAGVKGTGLGLAMVKHIVDAHGGEIRVESQPGVGTTFTILLPPAL
jgi:signal transduction histidine kinase